MGLRAVVDTVVKRKIPSPCWELNPTKEYIWLLVRRCRRQCNEELHNLCVMRSAYKILGRDHSEYLGVDGRIILEWILRKCGGEFLEYLSEY